MYRQSARFVVVTGLVTGMLVTIGARSEPPGGLVSRDLSRLEAAADAQLSPDGTKVAYAVIRADRPGRPYQELWVMDLATRTASRLGGARTTGGDPAWAPDGRTIAFFGRAGDDAGLLIARPDGSPASFVAGIEGTNHPLPSSGEAMTWSPDATRIAFVSSRAGPEQDANGDPMVITRYLYKPTASEGMTRFNDNRRLHVFIVDVSTKNVRQLTTGNYYEHSIAWSPRGDEILFVSNREADADRVFNYDIFAARVSDGTVRRLSETKHAEYEPSWSPNGQRIVYLGTTRSLTSSETTMEDTHVWMMDADGSNRRELGGAIDNRQGDARWDPDGTAVYFTVQERGSERLYRLPVAGGSPESITTAPGAVTSWSAGPKSMIAWTMATPDRPAELFVRRGDKTEQLTTLNPFLLDEKPRATVEPFTFKSFDQTEVEGFLTRPRGQTETSKHPLIVAIHGGPHGQQGPAFNAKAQVYAARGWATLMVNFRGSTGYGQKFADAIFKDQNGGEAKDVLAGVDAALERYPWIDASRLGIEGGSYGGQLTNWIITQTDRFKAAIPLASIANLVSFNYMAYYHDYLAVEFGSYPHENGLLDLLWERSPIRYVAKVKTPTLLLHGENDNDVPIAEAEQFYIALKDVGVETVLVRYPREGHGLRETAHVIDALDRSIEWYERHFAGAQKTTAQKRF